MIVNLNHLRESFSPLSFLSTSFILSRHRHRPHRHRHPYHHRRRRPHHFPCYITPALVCPYSNFVFTEVSRILKVKCDFIFTEVSHIHKVKCNFSICASPGSHFQREPYPNYILFLTKSARPSDFLNQSTVPSIRPSVCVCMSGYLSVCLSVSVSAGPCLSSSVCLSVSVNHFLYLSLSG